MSQPYPKRRRGKIAVHTRGFGFVDFEDEDAPVQSAFLAPPELTSLLEGDRVEVRLDASGEGRYRALEPRLVERAREEVLGRVEETGGRKGLALRLDPRLGNAAWPLLRAPRELRAGTLVVGVPFRNKPQVRYLRSVAEKDAGRTSVLVIHHIRGEHPPEALAEARKVRIRLGGRRDLRGVATLTIDAASSRDLDDALAVLPVERDGALRVLVSIADVDVAVPRGSRLDAEARRRGTSVYLPDLVVPMLPPSLSEDALSLLPGVDRPALTAELRIDREGRVTSTDLMTSVIRSTARLTYVDAAAFLDRGQLEAVPEEARSTLRWLRTAAARLSAARATRGGVRIEPDEVSLRIDRATGEPTSVVENELTSAHLLIERLMVATNEAVAEWLIARGLPTLFRVQDEPEEEQVERLADFAANFGFETAFDGELSARGLAAFEEQIRTSTVAPSIRTVLRWLLGRARYQPRPSPHYALAAPAYLHFTSPIRRYPDLVVHRVVKSYLAGERAVRSDTEALETLAAEANETARRSRKAEAIRLRMLIARLFASRIGEEHWAHIVSVKAFGLIVQLDELGVTGTVASEKLGTGPWELDTATYSLVSPKGRYMVGEAVQVRVHSADEDLGRLELELVGGAGMAL